MMIDKSAILNQKIIAQEGLTFDDILLLPNYADFKRDQVDLTVKLHSSLLLKLPVISSPMDTVTESTMAIALAQVGGLGIIHRNLAPTVEAEMVRTVKTASVVNIANAAVDRQGRLLSGAAVGAGADLEERIEALLKAEVDLMVVDTGHGYTQFILEAIQLIKQKTPHLPVMSGNIATYDGAKASIEAGADILRVGMGPGSICTTRIVTGMGVPQLTAVSEAVRAASGTAVTVVADGGIRQMGDIAKALAFGADSVMLGSLLSRFDESPGETFEVKGKKYKTYRGMGSIAAMKKGGAERYGQSRKTDEKQLIAEGVEGLVEYKGSVADYLYQVAGSLRSSLYYLGSRTIPEFFEKSRFIKISRAGLLESHPHTIAITRTGENYSISSS